MALFKPKKMVSNQDKEEKVNDLAMALNIKGMAKKKKMADGGMVPNLKENYDEDKNLEGLREPQSEIDEELEEESKSNPSLNESIADKIMKKRKMAQGGMVDPDLTESIEFEKINKDAVHSLDDEEDLSQPLDSNEHGNDLSDEDEKDMVSIIMKKLKAKNGM